MRYVVVTGGVLSGLGKGVTASSIGVLLKSLDLHVTAIKIDPYLNTDAGTMSPFEHGEVFVLDDGGEVDLDLGNYERFLDVTLGRDNNLTTGKIYSEVIEAERKGDYLGKTVQAIPHITDAIQNWISEVARRPEPDTGKTADVCVIELGGTIGDIESMPFIEALRQFQFKAGRENVCFVHVSLVPVIGPVGEQKTKPTQHSVRDLRALGITPDVLVCRSEEPLADEVREKMAAFCHVSPSAIMSAHDVSNIYRVPLGLDKQGLREVLSTRFNTREPKESDLSDWRDLADEVDAADKRVTIAMVGKYTGLADSYLSVIKALQHAAYSIGHKVDIEWIESEDLEDDDSPARQALQDVDGILVPGGFGDRGIEGKVFAAQLARTKGIPYLGICLGLQIAVIENARNVLGFEGANSTEFDPDTPHPVVIHMPDVSETVMGGTMRLGLKRTHILSPDSMAAHLYAGSDSIMERHRHRYEVAPVMVEQLQSCGLIFSGKDDSGERMEIIELADHPFFFATQFHPEFKSRPQRPSPPFLGLIRAAAGLPVRPSLTGAPRQSEA